MIIDSFIPSISKGKQMAHSRQKKLFTLIILLASCYGSLGLARPTVVELYTSQGCSSCPAAETLVRQLSKDPALLALSFHVHYFDYLGWKDPFASPENTERQKNYVAALGLDSVYTPQMIIDGGVAAVGSDTNAVEKAITKAEDHTMELPVAILPQADGNLRIVIGGPDANSQVPNGLVAWELHFNRGGSTMVGAGENSGAVLESTNNVIRSVPLALSAGRENDFLLPANFPEDGVAILVQQKPLGRVVGASYYLKPAAAALSGQQVMAR